LIALFLLVSIALSISNTLSACQSDLCVGQINPGAFKYGTHIPLLGGFRILDVIDILYIKVIVFHTVMFTVTGISEVAIPVEPMTHVGNHLRYVIAITLDRRIVDASDLAAIQYFSLSSREVICRHSWWQRRYF
jgi:hypothetical protein